MPTISRKLFRAYATSPSRFREDLLVDVDGQPRRFGDVMDPWQRTDFNALDPGLTRCNGRSSADCLTRAYLERPRGHSKTTDIAVLSVWGLAFASRPIRCYAYAADRDQARLLRDAMQTIIRLNPWLSEILVVEAHRVVNRAVGHPGEGGTLVVETSDAPSSYGIVPDMIIADELCHWQGDGSLWHSLLSSAAKRSNCLLLAISNAGFADSWQWVVREAARTNPSWYFSRLDGPTASWITPDRLQEQRRMLPAIAYARLWLNQWSSGGGDALREDDINAAFDDKLGPMEGRPWTTQTGRIHQKCLFVAGIDLGLTRDSSAIVTLAVPDGGIAGKIRLADHKVWRPILGRKVDLQIVEQYILALDQRFHLEQIAFDPWNAELLAQRLEADTAHRRRNQHRKYAQEPWMRELPPTGPNLRDIASLTIESFTDHRLQLYPCEPLRRDLLRLRIEERSYGYRLTSPRDGDGHGDIFSAFSLALLTAHDVAGKKPIYAGALKSPARSPIERAMARLERNQEIFDRCCGLGNFDYGGRGELARYMRSLGR